MGKRTRGFFGGVERERGKTWHPCQRELFSIAEIGRDYRDITSYARILLMPRLKTFWSTKKTSDGSKLEQNDGPEAEVEQLGLFLLKDNTTAVNNLE